MPRRCLGSARAPAAYTRSCDVITHFSVTCHRSTESCTGFALSYQRTPPLFRDRLIMHVAPHLWRLWGRGRGTGSPECEITTHKRPTRSHEIQAWSSSMVASLAAMVASLAAIVASCSAMVASCSSRRRDGVARGRDRRDRRHGGRDRRDRRQGGAGEADEGSYGGGGASRGWWVASRRGGGGTVSGAGGDGCR